MIVWAFVLFILSLINFLYDLLLWLEIIEPIDIRYVTFFNIIFLLITLGILYRMYFLGRLGEKEKLREKIRELEEEIKRLKREIYKGGEG
ncbi:MAG: hypothetical protein ABDH49_02155 [Candidatus Hydrothermales bacterium]